MTNVKSPDYTSPKLTFIARFDDEVVTRMTTFCANGKLNLKHGIAVARAAYESRTSNRAPPPIVAAKFVMPGYDDTVVKEYGADELEEQHQTK